MTNLFFTGSICLSDIPKDLIKRVRCKDGKERAYLNIAIMPRRQPQTFGTRTYTHYISCAPKKEERVDGVNYFIGDLETRALQPSEPAQATFASPANISTPPASTNDDLPF